MGLASSLRSPACRFLVSLQRIRPWSRIDGSADASGVAGRGGLRTLIMVAWLPVLIGGGVLLDGRDFRRGRCDLRGARRVAMAALLASMAVWALKDAHTLDASELDLLFTALATSLLLAAIAWCSYVALEPDARRFWPRTMIGWSRLVLGRVLDRKS